jgi:hypothetical protein
MPDKGIDPFPHQENAVQSVVDTGVNAVKDLAGSVVKVLTSRRARIRAASAGTLEEAQSHQSDVENHIKVAAATTRNRIKEENNTATNDIVHRELDKQHIDEVLKATKGAKEVQYETPTGHRITVRRK